MMKSKAHLKYGLVLAGLVLLADQLNKYWTLHIFQLEEKGRVMVTPFLDLVLVWNKGVSYGMFQQDSQIGQYLLIGLSVVISLGLVYWMRNAQYKSLVVALGLVIGGALGNAIDRALYGAVADFFLLHGFGFEWYVFNIADIAISLGVLLLLIDSFRKRA